MSLCSELPLQLLASGNNSFVFWNYRLVLSVVDFDINGIWYSFVSMVSCAYQSFVYLILRSVCANLLPIFRLGWLSSYWVVGVLKIFWTPILCQILCIVNIFSRFVACLFILLMLCFKEQNFNILMESGWSCIYLLKLHSTTSVVLLVKAVAKLCQVSGLWNMDSISWWGTGKFWKSMRIENYCCTNFVKYVKDNPVSLKNVSISSK